jgi:hypothetical protein
MINKIPLSLGLVHPDEIKLSRENFFGNVHVRKLTEDHCTFYANIDIEENKIASIF